jgi:predicted O-linked N-acetylglucosamine transferase (SPINDLY family)
LLGAPEDAPEVSPPPSAASETITFGSLHHPAKLNGQVLDLWARVLHAVPHSRLLMFRHSLQGSTRERISRNLADQGIARGRVDLRHAPLTSGETHLHVYEEIDVLLDAYPWGGHVTTCEALWMGVPVLTLSGRAHAGRLTASVLTPLGLTTWIAASTEEYVTLSVDRTNDRPFLCCLRSQL